MKLSQSSIKTKLTIILVGISLVSVLITTIALSIIGVVNLKKNIVAELEVSARILGERNLAAISFDDVESATKNLNVLASEPSIVRACLYNENGKLFAHYSYEDIKKDKCADEVDKIAARDEHFATIQPINHKSGETVGYIYVESDYSKVEQYVDTQVIVTTVVVPAVLVISILLAVLLRRMISGPILQLAGLAHQISTNRDFSLRAPSTQYAENSSSELDMLYRAFNTMLDEIDERERQLLAKNEELYNAKVAAEDANRAKSEFLANVSHELRTPLNAIIGFSSIIMNELFGALGSAKYMEYARDINESGVHLLDIINDILDLSKAEAGKLTLSFEEVNVAKAIRKCITLLSERAHEEGVTVIADIPDDLPYLIADRLRFIQIILNILSNAVKFTERGGRVKISVDTAVTGGEVTDFLITIEDSGIGMSADEIEKAFQSFGQIDSGLNRKYEGTGLGLPLTKKLVELHHGTIEIESEKNVGTKVKLHFLANPVYISELSDDNSHIQPKLRKNA